MLPDRVLNPGPLTYESGALRGLAIDSVYDAFLHIPGLIRSNVTAATKSYRMKGKQQNSRSQKLSVFAVWSENVIKIQCTVIKISRHKGGMVTTRAARQ